MEKQVEYSAEKKSCTVSIMIGFPDWDKKEAMLQMHVVFFHFMSTMGTEKKMHKLK